MAVSFQSIAQKRVTFLASGDLKENTVCMVNTNNSVGVCVEGDVFCGVVSSVKNGLVSVTMHGFVTMPYSGDAPTIDYCTLCSDKNGNVMRGGFREYLVVNVDTTQKTVGFFL